jgi:hypothetical protein
MSNTNKIRIVGLKELLFFLLGTLLLSCKADIFFQQRKYYGGGITIEFYSDNSYQFLEKTEGGYINKFSKGTWKQDGNKLLLYNGVSNPSDLPFVVKTSSSNEPEAQLVINILPKKGQYFTYLPSITDLLNTELVIGKTVYPLKDEINIVRLQQPLDKGYLRTYYKQGVERSSETVSDTLRSQDIDLKGLGNKILSIDVDCNPMYFARIKMANDTIRIAAKNKLKWNKIYLERPR